MRIHLNFVYLLYLLVIFFVFYCYVYVSELFLTALTEAEKENTDRLSESKNRIKFS
jgi:hypothetical protein